MLKNRLLYAAALVGTLVFHTYYTRWFSWYLLLLVLCLPVFSLLCSFPAIRALRVTARMDTSCVRGAQAQLVIGSTGHRRMPTPVYRFILTRTDALNGDRRVQHLQLALSASCQVRVPSEHCGSYRYELKKGRVFDYLGLFSFPLRLPGLGACDVMPVASPPQQLPNLGQFQARVLRPKYGGGFAEQHELREYCPGDQLRDVHWKLSAKTDALIVREPLEPNYGRVIVSLDWAGGREALDRTLDVLLWLSGWLLGREVRHEVYWVDPVSFEPRSRTVAAQADLDGLIAELVHTGLQDGTPSIAGRSFPHADWRYHICPEPHTEEVTAQ